MNPTAPDAPRVALYSHDTMGFGHIRRNIQLARALAGSPLGARVLLLSGIREGGAFALPPGVDSITLPAYRKRPDGRYEPRALGGDLQGLVALRSQVIRGALERFEPDLLVVDNVPTGAQGELRGTLETMAARGTRIVLGLRDVLDEPEVVRRQWWRQRHFEALRRHFDAVWVYGDARVIDTAEACGFGPDIRERLTAVGYLDPIEAGVATAPASVSAPRPYALCMVGGGQDGLAVTEAFADAPLPEGWRGVIVAGSMMPADDLARLQARVDAHPAMTLHRFVADPLALMRGAEAVVAMGGYNTVTELLSLGRRTLIVPRVKPRLEQWIRASRLAALGLVDCLHPQDLSAPALGRWLARPPAGDRPPARARLDFDGLRRVPELAAGLIAEARGERTRGSARATPKESRHGA